MSRVVETESMYVKRRISAAFKDIPGGQVLGATRDYSHRLIDFSLMAETDETLCSAKEVLEDSWRKQALDDVALENTDEVQQMDAFASSDNSVHSNNFAQSGKMPKVADYLREEGLLPLHDHDDSKPVDVTMEPLVFPAPRSARLQTLARGMTQAVSALGYAAIRGFGPAHPTVGELRYGTVEVLIDSPLESGTEEDAYYVGAVPVTEVESLFEVEEKNDDGSDRLGFKVGYGMVIGGLETKAIAMSVLDNCLMCGDKRFPTQDEEFVLYHVDGIEATGFISHLKLPHYVTFQSKLSSVRNTRADAGSKEEVR